MPISTSHVLLDSSGCKVLVNLSQIKTAYEYGDKTILWFGGENSTVIVQASLEEILEIMNG